MTLDFSMEDALKNLNPAQLAAVRHVEGPAVVYAGAGSGKTRTICLRIAELVQRHGVRPESILAVTFTNKAAKEMEERIQSFLGSEVGSRVFVSTFHSFCARYLRIFAKDIGFLEGFSIYDDGDQKSILKNIIKEMNIDEKLLSVATVKHKIDRIKNRGLFYEEYLQEIKNKKQESKENKSRFDLYRESLQENYDSEEVQKVYQIYQETLKKQNAMDFNDLLLEMYKALRDHLEIKARLQRRFSYFLIDEFQDTNPVQFKLISELSSHTQNVFIVGDDDQSIYSWRGADPSFILNFSDLYPDAKTYKLEQNYRSSNIIVKGALGLIQKNINRAKKMLFSNRFTGEKIRVKSCSDGQAEALFVVNEFFSKLSQGVRPSDVCILYRTNAQSRSLEDELRRRMLPYVIYGAVRFYERLEIKLLLSYLKLLINPADDVAFEKVINQPRRAFGDAALERLRAVSQERNECMIEALMEIVFGNLDNTVSRSLTAVKKFVMDYQKWLSMLSQETPLLNVLNQILSDIGFEAFLKSQYPEDFDDRWLNVIELRNALNEFEEKILSQEKTSEFDSSPLEMPKKREILVKFLEQALLVIEPTVHNVQRGTAEAATLMTIHAAKGLEFSHVFIVGLEEGILPHQNSLHSDESIEEERRLMYVAMTRAKETLTITHSRTNRYKSFLPAQSSRFLQEIPEDTVDKIKFKFNFN